MTKVWESHSYGYPEPSVIVMCVDWSATNDHYYKYEITPYHLDKIRAAYKKHKSIMKFASDIKLKSDYYEKIKKGVIYDTRRKN